MLTVAPSLAPRHGAPQHIRRQLRRAVTGIFGEVMIKEKLSQKSKTFLVQGGDARVFGQDADLRRKFDDTRVNQRFIDVWRSTIAPGLENGQVVTAEEAKELLGDKRAEF